MPTKRRNAGRSKHGRGKVTNVRCTNCGGCCPKDKAIKRFNVRNIVDLSSRKDITEACVIRGMQKILEKFLLEYVLPKLYIKQHYCISCALHSRIVRSQAKAARKIRRPRSTAAAAVEAALEAQRVAQGDRKIPRATPGVTSDMFRVAPRT